MNIRTAAVVLSAGVALVGCGSSPSPAYESGREAGALYLGPDRSGQIASSKYDTSTCSGVYDTKLNGNRGTGVYSPREDWLAGCEAGQQGSSK